MAEGTLDYNLRSTQGFVEILSSSNEWQTIDDLMAICDEAGYWESDFESRALTNAKKMRIRKIISEVKDKDGFPLFPSVTILDDDGKKKRVYKQETLFDVEDYKAVVNYHASLSNHHRDMAEGYVKRCEKKHKVQLSLCDLDENVDEPLDDEWTYMSSSSRGKLR